MSDLTRRAPRRPAIRRSAASLPVTLIAVIVLTGGTATLEAQSENSRQYVTIEKAEVRAEGKDHFIDLEASVELPANCKMEFVLTREFNELQINMVTVPANGKIRESFKIENYAPSAAEFIYMTRILPLDDQPRSVRKEIEGDPESYPPSILPLQRYHYDQRFSSGTPEQIAAEKKRIRKWFVAEYEKLAKIDGAQREAIKSEEYLDKKGELDEKKWRKMMDKDILEVLRASQKLYNEGLAGTRADLLAYRHILADLRTLSHAIALRTIDRSIALYKEHGLTPVESDTKPEGISTKVPGFSKRTPKSEDLVRMVGRIRSKLGMDDKDEDRGGSR